MKPPLNLKKAGSVLWQSIAAEYDFDSDSAATAILEQACVCRDRLEAAWTAIDRDGEFIEDRYGKLKQHPALLLEKDARAHFLLAMKQLNLETEAKRGPGRPPMPLGVKLEAIKK